MSLSTFCLQPAGDSPTRKGFWESILLGCIPVLFRRETYAKVWKTSFEIGDGGPAVGGEGYWDEKVAWVIEEDDLVSGSRDVVERLRDVSEEDVGRRQREMRRILGMVQFAIPGGEDADAVDVLVSRLARIRDRGP